MGLNKAWAWATSGFGVKRRKKKLLGVHYIGIHPIYLKLMLTCTKLV